ncbi:GntP family permease [Fictibacillus enclensis]|uniref:GntP family permease n=1 Tax=Fictibacillus enclensis TaxID=1017270 RepID=UPI0025A305DF|nr:GntP family permease [Fictibacillus enclensis]MDM5200417.1 GntP family permease [Fictibacillus enclensis]MDM5339780.1 GntP family permease [Fictibacillus enclensis]
MDIIIILLALFFLMFVAYRGFSVILFAPIAALFAVLLTDPGHVLPFFSGVFMEKMVGFIKLYFPVFLLGAIFGKVIEMSGFAKSITRAVIKLIGPSRAMLAIVLVGAILTYGGVSLFVVAFALYPFASELFKMADIPKRLIPGTIALGAFTFTMDAFPGTPQIQNIIPTTFFKTDTWAAPWLGLIGGLFVLAVGMAYLEWRRRKAAKAGEGYGTGHINEPDQIPDENLPNAFIAILPLLLVGIFNKVFTSMIPKYYGTVFDFSKIGMKDVPPVEIPKLAAVWAVEGALVIGIVTVLIFAFKQVKTNFNAGINVSIGGALLATLNTASEYGFGGVIAALPGFASVNKGMADTIQDPLVNEAVTTTALAGITGSASGGLSIALATMGDKYVEQADKLGIDPEVLHRVASMASGGMDTLPHNGAVITLLAVTGLTHKQSYLDIFAMTIIKTIAVFFVIGLYYLFGIV